MRILLICAFSLFAISFAQGQTIEREWYLVAMTNTSNDSTYRVPETKKLILKDGDFSYQKASEDSPYAYGDYIYKDKLLVVIYNQPTDTIKRFRVDELTETSFIIDEGHVKLLFTATSQEDTMGLRTSGTANNKLKLDESKSGGITANGVGRGLIGMVFLLLVCFLLSANRRKINWRLVATGLALQIIFAILVLKVDFVAYGFDWVSKKVVEFLNIAEEGAQFVFGGLVDPSASMGYIFAFKVLPTIVFFSAFTSLLYYLGILQIIVKAFAWVMSKTMRLSGAESLAAAANIFIGQTEAPLIVKPYLDNMTKSEMLCLMVGGMATIAGGVLAAFIAFLGGDSIAEQAIFAKHLLTASIMSAPAAIIIAKMLYPETEEVDRTLDISKDKIGTNLLDAISRGTTEGLKLAVNVGAMLLVFTAIIAVFNWIFMDWIGAPLGLNDKIVSATDGRYEGLSLQYLLGTIFAPVAWIIGVPTDDITAVGQLLGEKTILNEFFAYATLSGMKTSGTIVHYRSIVIATYALCGFANFASIGIQIGGIGVLAPSQRATLAMFGIKALIGGTIAALLTATIAGMLIG